MAIPIAVCGVSTLPEKNVELIGAAIQRSQGAEYVLRAVLGRMQFTLHATRRTLRGASRLVQAMSARLVKTRCAASRHSSDARVYGHTTMDMDKLSSPRPPLSLLVKHTKCALVGLG